MSASGRVAVPASPARIIAHRGASMVAPENTLSALGAARAQGADWAEFDVSLLGDGTPVLHHDAELGRCNDGTGLLSGLDRAGLAALDAGAWFGSEFRGEPVPTLAEALEHLDTPGISVNLELKVHDAEPWILAEAVVAVLARQEWGPERVLVSSFSEPALAALRRLHPDQPTALVSHYPALDWAARCAALGAGALHVNIRALTPSLIETAAAAGLALRVFTVNDPDGYADLRDSGVAGVITDDPAGFLALPEWAAWAAGRR